MGTFTLEKELATYEAAKPGLLANALGKFVLIRGEQVAGTYDAEMDAINAGYEKFGNVPFFVTQITEVEVPDNFVSDYWAT
jgi:hypothetical protein